MESEWSGVVDAVRASPQGGAQNWTLASSVNSCHARARRRLTQQAARFPKSQGRRPALRIVGSQNDWEFGIMKRPTEVISE